MPAQRKYYEFSTHGKSAADLVKEYNRLVSVANKRIRTITKEKYRSGAQAYRYQVEAMKGAYFVHQTGSITNYGRIGKQSSFREASRALQAITSFLSAQTSTVGGIKEVEKMRVKQIQEAYKNFKSPQFPKGIDKKTAKEIAIFLGSDKGKEAKQTYDSNDIIVALAVSNKLSRGAQSVLDAYLEFEQSGKEFGEWQRMNDAALSTMRKF